MPMTDIPALTPRQTEFLTLAAHGLTWAQIAERCYVSVHTVKATIENARERLGAKTTTEACAMAVYLGLITIEIDHSV
jgi:DNA-binding CsgD family transcriptional regulator